ncbi:hypothetical protein K466DRAFT_605542 [Polyporus arcularius HHB13444]|uniref:DUF6533 domain-containing protein n=1 Tax=Polyporus arcularius HHB13444 TaxID=1314778 RepID=A0A5C3NSG0_9APHY|nr:hypothetical protein K466DRAFT_605542 [Polyporus arcularius HHB13444]
MSSDDDTAAFIAESDALYIAGVCSIAVSALRNQVIVMYEYCITIGKEVRLFWGKKITGAAVLFFVNRYLVLFYKIDILANSNILVSDASASELESGSCARLVQSNRALQIAQYVPWAAFTGLRAFALSRNWFLSILAFALSMVSLVVNLVDYAFGVSGETDVTILSRTCLISADVILIGITWSRLSRRGLRHVESTNLFTEVLLRDGTLYFITLLTMNSLHLTLSLLAIAGVPLQAVSVIPLFTEPLTANLISRFLLHLQSVNQNVTGEDFEEVSGDHAGSLVFQRVVGSIGSSIGPTASFGEDEDESGGTVEDRGTRTSDYELSARSKLPDLEDGKDTPVDVVETVARLPNLDSDGIQTVLA